MKPVLPHRNHSGMKGDDGRHSGWLVGRILPLSFKHIVSDMGEQIAWTIGFMLFNMRDGEVGRMNYKQAMEKV